MICLLAFFVPGTLLIFLSSWPNLLGETFPFRVFKAGMLYLYPLGGGGIDTIVDIFAAKQFHPILQDDLVESFFIWSTVAAAGGQMIATLGFSMIANVSVPGAFLFIFLAICSGTILFCFYTKRYVVRKLLYKEIVLTWKAAFQSVFCWKKSSVEEGGKIVPALPGFSKVKQSNGGSIRDDLVDAAKRLLLIIPVQGIFIPFSVPYSQVFTLVLPQSYSMRQPPNWSGANMFTCMNLSTVIAGIFVNRFFYPYMEKKNIHICTTRRVAIGAVILMVFWLIVYGVDQRIRRVYAETGEMISIGWQALPMLVGGFAYPFFLPPMDELTYRVAPSEYKVLGNAINKFIQAGIGAIIATAIYSKLGRWFVTADGTTDIMTISAYTTANTDNFFLLMAAISFGQALFLVIPFVENWVKRIEEYVKVNTI